jgi:anthranilate/para-aminobenzoate synthase component I
MQSLSFSLQGDPAEFLASDSIAQSPFYALYQKDGLQLLAFHPLTTYRIAADCSSVLIKHRGGRTRIETLPGGDPFPFLNAELSDFAAQHAVPDTPFFRGGLLGINSFEGLSALLKLDCLHPGQTPFFYGLFDTFLITDLAAGQATLCYGKGQRAVATALQGRLLAWQDGPKAATRLAQTLDLTAFRARAAAVGDFAPKISAGIDRIKPHLTCGNSFQTVLSHELTLPITRAPFESFLAMRQHPSAYKYFVQFEEVCIAGISPENLVEVAQGRARMRPLAGTQPCGTDALANERALRALRESEKEIAEHTMLVDLVRNDLGRICENGSVTVQSFQQVERFGTVMHLASEVEGRLPPGTTALDVMRALSPAGTMTGAPKRRSIQILQQLEPSPRGFYSGNIGFADVAGQGDFAILIRSAIYTRPGQATLRAGMGIVLESTAADESEEWLHKVFSCGKECL